MWEGGLQEGENFCTLGYCEVCQEHSYRGVLLMAHPAEMSALLAIFNCQYASAERGFRPQWPCLPGPLTEII